MTLPALDRRILDFEARIWRHQGAKDEAIRKEFGWSPWVYTQMLFAVCETPAALVYAPMLVNRTNRLRRRRRSA